MDILTQGLLGGVLAQSVAQKKEMKLATVVGFIAGLIADADIFIFSSNDALLNVEFHRHFTHSLFFIPFGAAIATLLLWPFFRKCLTPARLYLYSVLGYSMSGLLDACTSYGTHLLWPFSDERVAFNLISIIDPVFTLVLLVSLVYALRTQQKKIARIGLLLAAGYMSLGFMQLQRAQSVATELALSRGHQAERHVVKPTLANLFLWRSVYLYENRFYVDAVRVGVFADNRVFAGESVEKFNREKDLPGIDTSSVLVKDIERFKQFSNDYLVLNKARHHIIGDLRYSMLPTSAKPLWGIVFDKDKPGLHADYQFFRDARPQLRNEFIRMLFLTKTNQ